MLTPARLQHERPVAPTLSPYPWEASLVSEELEAGLLSQGRPQQKIPEIKRRELGASGMRAHGTGTSGWRAVNKDLGLWDVTDQVSNPTYHLPGGLQGAPRCSQIYTCLSSTEVITVPSQGFCSLKPQTSPARTSLRVFFFQSASKGPVWVA